MNKVEFSLTLNNDGEVDMVTGGTGTAVDMANALFNCMIENPDVYEIFFAAVKAYEAYRNDNLNN